MQLAMIGIGIYILGFLIFIFCAGIFNVNPEFTYYYGIFFSIPYLSAIVVISTSLILKELRTNKNYRLRIN